MYRYLKVYYSLVNDVYADFEAIFLAVTCIVTVVMLYASIKAFKLVSLVLYLLFPLSALMCIVVLTGFTGFIYLVDRRSSQLLSRMEINAIKTTVMENKNAKILRKGLRAMKPLRFRVGTFGYICLQVPKAEMEQIFNYILLLLNY